MTSAEIQICYPNGWTNPEPLPAHTSAHSRFLMWRVTSDSEEWVIKLCGRACGPRRMSAEPPEEYAARCLHETARLAALFPPNGEFPGVKPALIRVTDPRKAEHILLRDILDLEHALDASALNRILEDSTLAGIYPLYAASYRWYKGIPLIDPQGGFAPLTPLQVLNTIQQIARIFGEYRKKGVYYLPLGEHVIVQDGRVSGFVGLGHAVRVSELFRRPEHTLRQFFSGLYRVRGSFPISTSPQSLVRTIEDQAMRSLGYFLYDLALSSKRNSNDDNELREHLVHIAAVAGNGLPGGAMEGPSQATEHRYQDWEELASIIDDFGETRRRDTVRIGVVFDYANVITALSGWDLNIAALVSSFNHYQEGRRVTYRYAAVVTNPDNAKERIQAILKNAGFEVGVIESDSPDANQADDEELMRIMRLRLREVDEVVLITADGDYAETLAMLKEKGLKVRVVHFSPVSRQYGKWVDEVIPGLTRFRKLISPGVPWGHSLDAEVTVDDIS